MQSFTPIEYLKIDIASNFGLDKKTWNERLAWFSENETNIENLLTSFESAPHQIHKDPLMAAAKVPALFFAGVRAYAQAREGKAISYPISLDATASGAQILSCLINCEASARLCNVLDTGDREDFYTNIYDRMIPRLEAQGIEPTTISQPDTKVAVMTSLYGSTRQPRRIFGEGPVLGAFYETMIEDAAGAWALNEALQSLWNPDAVSHDWILPDNFHVKVKVMDDIEETFTFMGEDFMNHRYVNRPTMTGLSIGANVVHSIDGMIVREMSRRCSYDPAKLESLLELLTRPTTTRPNHRSPNHDLVETLWLRYQESGFLSARILELIDEANIHLVDKERISALVKTLPIKPFPTLAVHDCWRVHPNYGNDLRRQYNQILHEVAASSMLAFIAGQIAGHPLDAASYGNIAEGILQADYALS